jgi:hypothetical protein
MSVLNDLAEKCSNLGITLESLITTLNDARQNAEIFNRQGEVIPDYATRIKAASLLFSLLQVNTLGKLEVLKKTTSKDIRDFIQIRHDNNVND